LKKIAILTYHNALNYGAVFQAYALKEYLNRQENVEAEILNYGGVVAKYASKSFLFKYCIKHPTYLFNLTSRLKMMRKFNEFRKEYLEISDRLLNKKDVNNKKIDKQLENFDAFIVGSDQVWNPNLNSGDRTYLLDFTDKEKYAYAASLGSFDDKKVMDEYFKNSLDKFSGISLRENSSLDNIKKYYKDELTTCLDPVFLLDMDEWKRLYKKDIKKNASDNISQYSNADYVLYFSLDMDTIKLKNAAVSFAKKRNLKIIFVTDNERKERYKDLEHFGVASPSELLFLMDNASYIFTNSFHGTALSVILHKEFFVETNIASNNRILDLLENTSLEDRALLDGKFADSLDEKACSICWEKVDEKIDEMLKGSKEFLKKITG